MKKIIYVEEYMLLDIINTSFAHLLFQFYIEYDASSIHRQDFRDTRSN